MTIEASRHEIMSALILLNKRVPPIAADPGGFPAFRIFYVLENDDFLNFPMGFGVWEGLQSMGNGCGLQMDGFSAHFEPCGSIFDNFLEIDVTIVS